MDFRLAFVASLFALFFVVEAHHRHHGNSRNNNYRPPPIVGLFSWTRDLGSRRQCQEHAYVPPGTRLVYAESTDNILESLNIQPSSSFYDFTSPSPIQVLAPTDGPCYYLNTTANLNQTIGNLNNINNTVIPNANEVPLDGTGTQLTPEQVRLLLGAHPALQPVCDGRPIIPTYPFGAAPFAYPGPTSVLPMFSLDSAFRVTIPLPPNDGRRGHGGHQGTDYGGHRGSDYGGHRGTDYGRHGHGGHRGNDYGSHSRGRHHRHG